MRIDLKKFLFIGFQKEKDAFFAKAQEFGLIHFISKDPKSVGTISHDVQTITGALKILRGLPPVEQETLEQFHLGDGIAYKVVDLHHKIEKLHEELRILGLDIARVKPFGDFSLDDVKKIEKESNRVVQFFAGKPGLAEDGLLPDTAVYVNSDQGLDYFIAISPAPIVTKDMIEMKIDHPLGVLLQRQQAAENELDRIEAQLKTYAKYDSFLHETLLYRLDKQNLQVASSLAQPAMEGELFAIEGWTPENKIDEMYTFVNKMHVFVEEIEIGEKDPIPTYLQNEGFSRMGEDLVNIYDTPSATDKDPSLWVLFSFALFFSVIMGDGGYGLVFLLAALFVRYKMGSRLQGAGKRFWKLAVLLSVSCIAWGLFTNSFFAMSLSPTNPIRAYSPLTWLAIKKIGYSINLHDQTYLEAVKKYSNLAPITDPREFLLNAVTVKDGELNYELADTMNGGELMEIAIVIGVVHLILSMLRYVRRNWASAGWVLVLIGSFLYFPGYLGTPSFINYVFGVSMETAQIEGLYLIEGGFALAIVLSLIQNKWLGLLEPMTAIQILADVLSYLRLYALGLAGGIVAATVNEFAASSGLILGMILALIGHITNIVLSIMGGVIHGLRLNFIEWYHYSFHGGGKPYRPLKKLFNVKKEQSNEL